MRKSPGLLPLGARELKGGATARPPDLGCHSPRLHPRAGPMRVVGNRRIAGQPRSDERRRPMCMNSWVRPPRTCERHKADCQPRSGGRRQRARPTRRRDPVGYRRRMGRVRRQEWQDHSGERPQCPGAHRYAKGWGQRLPEFHRHRRPRASLSLAAAHHEHDAPREREAVSEARDAGCCCR